MSFTAPEKRRAAVLAELRKGPRSIRQLLPVIGDKTNDAYVCAIISNLRAEGHSIETEAFYTLTREATETKPLDETNPAVTVRQGWRTD